MVLYKISKGKFHIADPGSSQVVLTEAEFAGHWLSDTDKGEGIALLISPTPYFYEQEDEKAAK